MSQYSICLTPLRVVPGSRLARPALRADGVLLLAAGTELDQGLLANLFERGIEHIYIEVNDTRDEKAIARDVYMAESRVEQLFRGPSNEARKALRAAISAYRRQGVE